MPERIAGHRGRLPVKAPADRFAIKYVHQYLAQPLPAPAYPVDVTAGIAPYDWGLLGNGPDPTCTIRPDGVGDCGFAGRQHVRMAKAAAGHEPMPAGNSDQLVAEYLAYDHGQDIGVNLADVLLYWYRNSKILAFAPVDHTDPAAVDSATAAFHGCYVGVDLTDDADDLFQAGEPWTVAQGQQPNPQDGHCIVKVQADGHSLDGYVTWGALQPATVDWSKACLREAWVLITQEDADAACLDIAALRADIDALGGTGGDGSPAPTPIHNHANMLIELADDVEAVAAKVRAYLARHGL